MDKINIKNDKVIEIWNNFYLIQISCFKISLTK